MISWLLLVLRTLGGMARSRVSLSAENAILRHQLAVLQRGRPRPLLRPADRVLWIWLCRHWSRWRSGTGADPASHGPQVAPRRVPPLLATTIRWVTVDPDSLGNHISLIRRISSDHPEWGEDRIALELKAKLGVEHAPSTIRRYMVTREGDGRPGLHHLAHLPGWPRQRVVDHGPDHPTPVELLGAVCPGAHGATEPKGSARGGDGLAYPDVGEAAGSRSDPFRLGSSFLGP